MNNNVYLIPANSKRSLLIFGMFRMVDLIIFGVGLGISFILLLSVTVDTIVKAVIVMLPLVVAGFLVFPIPNYQNVLVLLQEIFYFLNHRRNYVWRGWCYKYAEKDEK